MVSYWKLIDMTTSEVISVGKNERSLIDLKFMYENKLNTPTKLIKCFGNDNYNKDWNYLKIKCNNILSKCEHKC